MMTRKPIFFALVIAALMLAGSAALKYAQGLELIGPEFVRRAVQVGIGLILAAYGNVIPKGIERSRMWACTTSRLQSSLRVGGWAFTLAGLGYAGLWAFAPFAIANVAAMPLVAAATLVTAGYCGYTALSCRWRAQDPSI